MMFVNFSDVIPLVTILGAASAPTFAAIWAENRRTRDAMLAANKAEMAALKVAEVKHTLVATSAETSEKLHTIEHLVNDQLTQAVNRFAAATTEIERQGREIEHLKALLKVGGG